MKNTELKTEIKNALKEVLTEGFSSFFDSLFRAETKARESVPDVQTAAEIPVVLPENFLAIISGYLYMSIKELGYSIEDLRSIMQRVEHKINAHSFDDALTFYKKAETELLPLVVAGIIVPNEFVDLKISELKFNNSLLAVRITNVLLKNEITFIKNFRDKNVDLLKVRNFGKLSLSEFKDALRRTVGELPYVSLTPENKPADTYSALPLVIGGIEIPEQFLDFKITDLNFSSKISATKISNKLKKYNVSRLRDFLKNNAPKLDNILSYKGKISFIESLKRTVGGD
jgi:ribosomal protein S20